MTANMQHTDVCPRFTKLRVASYNIRTGIGMSGAYCLDGIVETLTQCEADIIALQEVDVYWGKRSNYDNQVEQLSNLLAMHSFFAPIYTHTPAEPGQPHRQFGLAILSRYPYASTSNRSMVRLSTQVKNATPAPAPGFADVVISMPGQNVRVMNVQLDYRSDPAVRAMQVDDIFAAVPISQTTTVPTILMGDFNANPGAPELAPLEAVWADAWTLQGNGNGFTFPADTPTKRIDRIALSAGIAVQKVWVPDTQASDHRPVVADLLLLQNAQVS